MLLLGESGNKGRLINELYLLFFSVPSRDLNADGIYMLNICLKCIKYDLKGFARLQYTSKQGMWCCGSLSSNYFKLLLIGQNRTALVLLINIGDYGFSC